MKKFVYTLALLLCFMQTVTAKGNLNLNTVTPEDVSVFSVEESVEIDESKTLKEKLQDVYHLEIDSVQNFDKPNFLLEDILTKRFSETSPVESIHFWAGYNSYWNTEFEDNDSDNRYRTNFIRAVFDGKFKNKSGDFRLCLGPNVYNHDKNFMSDLFTEFYVTTNKIPHHTLKAGHFRPKFEMEGSQSGTTTPFVMRGQIDRKFAAVRKTGVNLHGDYKLVDYDLGGFNSSTYYESFFNGGEFDGWINIKPLGLTDGRYGSLTMGGGIQAGNRGFDYNLAAAYLGYRYKRLMLECEWANADGYNGASGKAVNKKADGFFATARYMLTPKLQAVARYDQFDQDKKIKNNISREYSAGLNYFIKNNGLKLVLDYIFCQKDSEKDSHRIMLGTQILL